MQKRDHTKLLCDISELADLFSDARSLDIFLQNIVTMVAEHMSSNVCSVYLYYENKNKLILTATKGLSSDSIGKIILKLGEGLTGLALKELRPICVKAASQAPGYRCFPNSGEDAYESFLAVPIIRGHNRIGVLVIQKDSKNFFNQSDINTCVAITSQLANTIETAKLLMRLKEKPKTHDKQERIQNLEDIKFIKGKVGSPGCAHAPVELIDRQEWHETYSHQKNRQELTEKDLYRAITTIEQTLNDWQITIEKKLSDAASLIFSAQMLMLKDKNFIEAIINSFHKKKALIPAIIKTVNDYALLFDALPQSYLREKKQDILDIGRLLLDTLSDSHQKGGHYRNKIIIAQDLFSSELLKYASQGISGIVVLSGGITGHLSILCRSLELPLIISKDLRLLELPPDTQLLLDGDQGNIYINPTKNIIKQFQSKEEDGLNVLKQKKAVKPKTFTKDQHQIHLLANINLLSDLNTARAFKAEGIGLYRTEFPFIVRSDFPSEEEQFLVYNKLISGMTGKEITFRTLDIGGDKVLSYYDYGVENNPFLGMRSIRFSLKHQNIFRQQLRAILRAGYKAQLRIMFPMISSLDEFCQAKQIVYETMDDLKNDRIKYHKNPAIGMMIELPAVMGILHDLADESDFFSIGTNDFIQYMLAVDRTNEKVADLYLPYHPAILRALKQIMDTAIKHKKDVAICGDMSHDTKYLEFLIGIGFNKFSLDPRFLPRVQPFIEQLDISTAQKKAGQILKSKNFQQIMDLLDIR
ncbi:MAG: phosphoenolpyruvate--protein phosphotransferase [Candidatus Omnitrophica bacterium]|nr:phosphoenolpyruvate--protein phosphotransferase [Candidatus Omnitrophota bacterium]